MLGYLVIVQPFTKTWLNKVEIANEFLFMILSILMLSFSDHFTDPYNKILMGKVFIGLVFTQFSFLIVALIII